MQIHNREPGWVTLIPPASMALIILSRPFPRGISMRITYVRAGAVTCYTAAREMLSLYLSLSLSLSSLFWCILCTCRCIVATAIAEVKIARSLAWEAKRTALPRRRRGARDGGEGWRRRFLTGWGQVRLEQEMVDISPTDDPARAFTRAHSRLPTHLSSSSH